MFKIPRGPDYPDLDQLKPAISQTGRWCFELFNGKLPELLCISNLLFDSQARCTSKTWANLCVSVQNRQDFGHSWFEKSSFRRVKLLAGSGRSCGFGAVQIYFFSFFFFSSISMIRQATGSYFFYFFFNV